MVKEAVERYVAKLVGLKKSDIDWASSLGKMYGEEEELDGRGDAARHLALGWLTTISEKPEAAKAAIQLREVVDTDFLRSLANRDFFGKKMDFENNALGATIQADTREEALAQIKELIASGKALHLTPKESIEMRGYAQGGGVQSLAPIAKNMFRGYDDVKRGVGSYMPHTRYSRRR